MYELRGDMRGGISFMSCTCRYEKCVMWACVLYHVSSL